jgi:hypothetical protein
VKRPISFLFLIWLAAPVLAESLRTHCQNNEEVYFNCLIKGSTKVASVCGLGYSEESNEPGYVQYRFGPIGNHEFAFPDGQKKEDLQDKFMFSGTRNSEYTHYEFDFQFENLGYAYSILHSEDRKNYPTKYSDSVTLWQLVKKCSGACPERAPYAAPEKKMIRVFSCTNQDAGQNLNKIDRIVRLITTPGKSRATKYR